MGHNKMTELIIIKTFYFLFSRIKDQGSSDTENASPATIGPHDSTSVIFFIFFKLILY